jgi:NAD(P)-dependent dehydrogenase (short-subunit alcohol dehydrogenase family)
MREFEGRVAVVTGGASGIGRALAERFAREGMKVVVADVEEEALSAAVREMRQAEHQVTGVLTDVSRPESVEELARRALEAYGKVHIVCNNAGVAGGSGGPVWEQTLKDWQWLTGVNLWGVVHGVRTFLPIMLRQGEEGHVVNTASVAGLVPGSGIYGVTKHGVVALSEALYSQLKQAEAKVGVSVLCPGFVRTRIHEAARNRPRELQNEGAAPADPALRAFGAQRILSGSPPEMVAEKVFQAVREERFWVLPHDDFDEVIRARMESILSRANPAVRPLQG